ncbi:hypothetical protein MKW92_017946, partial [Papaver armeniacum]
PVKDSRTPSKKKKKTKDVLEMPPNVRKRVEALSVIQTKHDEKKTIFLEERAILEVEFQEMVKPFYEERFSIVSGEVDGEAGVGVPNFWLNAMKANEVLAKEITKRDEDPLMFLKDIRWDRIDTPKGFKLSFIFGVNRYFNNAILEKTYHVTNDDESILEKVIG